MDAEKMYEMASTWVALKRDNPDLDTLDLLHERVSEYGADTIDEFLTDICRYFG